MLAMATIDLSSGEDSSEDDFDQKELEVALYSQTHHDSSGLYFSPKTLTTPPTLSFRVGVSTSTVKDAKINQPMGLSSFIAFTVDTNAASSCDEQNMLDVKSEVIKLEPEFGESYQAVSTDDVIQVDNDEKFREGIKKELESMPVEGALSAPSFSTSPIKKEQPYLHETVETQSKEQCLDLIYALKTENEICEADNINICDMNESYAKETLLDETIVHTNVMKSNHVIIDKDIKKIASSSDNKANKPYELGEKFLKERDLLPFQVTRKPKQKEQVIIVSDKEDDAMDHSGESPGNKCKKPNGGKLLGLGDFLELPKSKTNVAPADGKINLQKQKSLSKKEAAVKPRKPEIQVRRPRHVAVLVRHRQMSDTDTDYSDSDNQSTPVKKDKARTEMVGQEDSSKVSQNNNNETDTVTSENLQFQDSLNSEGKEGQASDTQSSSDDSDSDEDLDRAESDSVDSDNSAAILLDDGTEPSLTGLDFNLADGVSNLLSESKGTENSPNKDDKNWKIDDRDRYSVPLQPSRYFAPRSIQCRNCRKDGHMSRNCPEPLKQRCIFCSADDHQWKTCPEAVCFNCSVPGHRTTNCPEEKMDWKASCNRCWMTGHREEVCPDKWRQFHMSVSSSSLKLGSVNKNKEWNGKKNTRVFCCNCGKKGHWGHECNMRRMNQFVAASYPFIAEYDSKTKLMGMLFPKQMSGVGSRNNMPEKHSKKKRRKDTGENWASLRQQMAGAREARLSIRGNNTREKQGSEKRSAKQKKAGRSMLDIQSKSETLRQSHSSHFMEHHPIKRSGKRTMDSNDFDNLPNNWESNPGPASIYPTKSSKKRKRERLREDDVLVLSDLDNSIEDFTSHQVSNNEWWLNERDDRDKPKKRTRGRRNKKRHKESAHDERTIQKHNQFRHREVDLGSDKRTMDMTDFNYMPNNWESNPGPGSTHPAKSSKKRMREQLREDDVLVLSDLDNSIEDFTSHQVSSNEWWLHERDDRDKHKQRTHGRRNRKRHRESVHGEPNIEQHNQFRHRVVEVHGERNIEQHNQFRHREVDRESQDLLVNLPNENTTFVYVKEPQPSLAHDAELRREFRDLPSASGLEKPSRSPKNFSNFNRNNNERDFSNKSFGQSRDPQIGEFKRTSEHFNEGTSISNFSVRVRNDDFNTDRYKKFKKSLRDDLEQSTSRSRFQRGNKRKGDQSKHSGFQARHKHFISMKNACDTKLAQRH